MSKAMQLVGIILLGVFTLVIAYFISDVQNGNELDYYLLQEVTEASMYDAVDYSFYRETGLLKVDRDMFLESFNRRFAQSVSNDRDYHIKIIDFNETPPKASIEVSAPTIASVKGETAMIVNRVSGIIESIYDDVVMSRPGYEKGNGDETPPTITFSDVGSTTITLLIKDNNELDKYLIGYIAKNKYNGKINTSDIEYQNKTTSISGKKEHTLSVNTNAKEGYYPVVKVYDKAGNTMTKVITYNGPVIESCSIDEYGILTLKASDELSEISTANVKVNGNKILEWKDIKNNTSSNKAQYTINLSKNNFYKDYVIEGTNNYVFTVSNKVNRSSTCTVSAINGDNNHAPIITVPKIEDGTNNPDKDVELDITITDSDNDLLYYAITGSNTEPSLTSSNWKSVSDSSRFTTKKRYTGREDITYYIWAKDKYGHIAKAEVPIVIKRNEIFDFGEKGLAYDPGSYIDKECAKGYDSWKYGKEEQIQKDCTRYNYIAGNKENLYQNQEINIDINSYSQMEIEFETSKWDKIGCDTMQSCTDSLYVKIGDEKYVLSSHSTGGSVNSLCPGCNNYGGYNSKNNSFISGKVKAVIDISSLKSDSKVPVTFGIDGGGNTQYRVTVNIYSIKFSK